MKHHYAVYFEPTRSHSKQDIQKLVACFDELSLLSDCNVVISENARAVRRLSDEAKNNGFRCSFQIRNEYEYSDALSGVLAILWLGLSGGISSFKASLPGDAFEFPPGCPRCGLGARWVKPHVLTERAVRCGGNFHYGIDSHTRIPLMRSEIGEKVIKATGARECMRHPVTRSGRIVKEWMEPVPGMTMPALSTKSEGIMWDYSFGTTATGDPPERIEPCPECGRHAWGDSYEKPRRLVYSREAVKRAEKHGVVWMREPMGLFPTFDPKKRVFKDFYGWPLLLFSRKAIEAVLPYCQMERIRATAHFEPVFSE